MLTNIPPKEPIRRKGVQLYLKKHRYPTFREQRMNEVKHKVDQVLQQDIQYLKYNFHTNPQHQLEVTKQNNLINQYVHNNYEEYNLMNPLPHLSNRLLTQSQVEDSRKKTKKLEVYSSSKLKHLGESGYNQQEYKQLRFKTEPHEEEFKQQPTKRITNKYQYQRYDIGSQKNTINFGDYSRTTKGILSTHPTEHKIYQSGHRLFPSQFSIRIEQPPAHEQSMIQSHYINEGIYPRFTFNRSSEALPSKVQTQKNPFANVTLKQQKKPQLYSERFRYCVGCEQSLLEINIEYHQSVCTLFKHAFSLSYQQLSDYLGAKIQKIQKEILNFTHYHSSQGLSNSQLNSLVQAASESKKWGFRTQQFINDYKRINFCCKMQLQQLQKISKLNWFLQIYENIRKKIKI